MARDAAPLELTEFGELLAAPILHEEAPRDERAPLVDLECGERAAGDGYELLVLPLGSGRAPRSPAVYGCIASRWSDSGGALLQQEARVHHRDPVAHGRGELEVVCDEQHRQAPLPPLFVEDRHDLGLCRDVEGGRRLVGEDEAGYASP